MKLILPFACGLALGALFPAILSAQSNAVAQTNFAPVSSAGGCVSPPIADDPEGHGLDLANLDRSVKPCDDFFHFADGGWIKKNPIPPEYPSWGSYNQLAQDNREKLHHILETEEKNSAAKPGSIEQKIGDFYASCMNEEAVEKAGATPLDGEFARIAEISNLAELEAEIARMQGDGADAAFLFSSQQDNKNSTQEIGMAQQGGLGMPDRDYYFKTDEKSQKLRDAYVLHVQKMFELLGDDPGTAAAEAKMILAFETKLAKSSMTRVDQRNPDNVYHKMDLAGLKTLTPHFDWDAYFHEVGYPAIDAVNVREPEFFKEVDTELAATSLSDWKIYLRWHLIDWAAPSLSSKFVDEDFDFSGHTLSGTLQNLPRWKRCVIAMDKSLGEALGQFYVKEYFPPEAKARALEMVQNIVAALRADLQTLDWMGEETRKEALAKLDAIQLKIGYPDKWRDYSAFTVDRGIYIDNVRRGELFERNYHLARIGKPVDRAVWNMTPPTVNAYYNSSMNEIVFPAGILQPPFYDYKRDAAMNYGGIGVVIGHEMTHGFDDQGSRYDAHGNLRNWWTAEDLKNFKARGDCVAKQFDGFLVQEGLHENGKLVEGESIADFGGLTISFAAFQKASAGKPSPGLIDGFTPEQRFFLAYGGIWAGSDRPEYERLIVSTNPHPLGRFRVMGPLENMPEFEKAFRCSASDAMIRPASERCRIW
ncbi:MAG: M13 family metallopeptidase [Candidatus Acidiferrales bacterium]